MRLRFFALITFTVILLVGCGQTGPLYLPNAPAEEQQESNSQ